MAQKKKTNTKKTSAEKIYIFDKPENVKCVLYALYLLCAGLFIADFILHRHNYHQWEEIPAFYALFGFGAYVIIVASAALLRKLVMRPEDYYEPKANKTKGRKKT